MHLLSETVIWKTESEFVTPDGVITKARGETSIEIKDKIIFNHSWVKFGDTKIVNNYKIEEVSRNEYGLESTNSVLGIQRGKFNIDRNTIFSKFKITETNLNGFEIITRYEDECFAAGALYDREN